MRGRAKVVHDPLAREIPPPLAYVDPSLTTVLGIGLEQLTGWHYRSPWPAPKRCCWAVACRRGPAFWCPRSARLGHPPRSCGRVVATTVRA